MTGPVKRYTAKAGLERRPHALQADAFTTRSTRRCLTMPCQRGRRYGWRKREGGERGGGRGRGRERGGKRERERERERERASERERKRESMHSLCTVPATVVITLFNHACDVLPSPFLSSPILHPIPPHAVYGYLYSPLTETDGCWPVAVDCCLAQTFPLLRQQGVGDVWITCPSLAAC